MAGYDGQGTIPRSNRAGEYRDRVCGRGGWGAFFVQGAVLTLFSCFPTVWGSLLRPWVYRLILGRAGAGCYLEKNIRFYRPSRVRLGKRVFVGEGAFFDVGGRGESIEIGDDSHVSRLVTIRTQYGRIAVGSRVNIGSGSFLYGYGDIEIGDDCLLANQVEVVTGGHEHARRDVAVRFQGRRPTRTVIGRDCWVGTHAVILGGASLGEGSIVGAGAVVTGDIPPFSIAAGVPARVIGTRPPGGEAGT